MGGCHGSQRADSLPWEPAVVGGGHRGTGTSLQEWVGVEADHRLAAVEELQQTLAWNSGSGHQEGVGEARAFLGEDWEGQERGSAVLGAMVELGLRESGCFGGAEVCWVSVGEPLLECLV